MDSILTTIKKLLGVDEEYTHFDPDIIIAINTALMILAQLGVGPSTGFMITDKNAKWVDFFGDRKDIEGVKTYIHLKSKLLFDPPSNSFLVDAMERQVKETEWRLNVQVDDPTPITTPTTTEEGVL